MAIINDSGQNFTLYYNVLEYFKTIMSNHPSLGSVTQGDIFEIDAREFPVYPLGNILITNASFGLKTSTFTCQLTIADKVKLKNNESSGSTNFQVIPFNGTDDVVDIHANTLAILNDLTSYTQRSVEAAEINDDIDCVPFKDNFDNGLAGWVCTFDMLVHNDKNICLFPLLPQVVVPPSPTTTTTTGGPTTTTTAGPTTTTTTSTTTTTTLAPITFEASGSCNGFEGNGVIDVYNVLGGGSFPKFVGLNDGIFYPLTTPTQSFTGLGDGTFEVTVKNNEGFEASQSVVIDCAPVPTTTTTTSTTSTTTTTLAPISINVSGSCLPSGGAQLTILGITGGSGAPYFHSLQQDGVYLPSSSEYNTYTNLNNTIYTVYADNNFGSSGSQSVDLSGCQPLPTTTTTTTTTTVAPFSFVSSSLISYLKYNQWNSGSLADQQNSYWYDVVMLQSQSTCERQFDGQTQDQGCKISSTNRITNATGSFSAWDWPPGAANSRPIKINNGLIPTSSNCTMFFYGTFDGNLIYAGSGSQVFRSRNLGVDRLYETTLYFAFGNVNLRSAVSQSFAGRTSKTVQLPFTSSGTVNSSSINLNELNVLAFKFENNANTSSVYFNGTLVSSVQTSSMDFSLRTSNDFYWFDSDFIVGDYEYFANSLMIYTSSLSDNQIYQQSNALLNNVTGSY
jgi:hypothetical protein